MSRRISVLVRGPGVLITVLAAIVIVSLLHHAHTTHAGTTVTRATARPTVTKVAATPSVQPSAMPSPQPTATPRPRVIEQVLVRIQGATDRATGMQASIYRIAHSRRGTNQLQIVIGLRFTNHGHRLRRYDRGNFYLIEPTGAGIAASGYPPHRLKIGFLRPGHRLVAHIAFRFLAQTGTYLVTWSDNNRLIPPATIARITVTRRTLR